MPLSINPANGHVDLDLIRREDQNIKGGTFDTNVALLLRLFNDDGFQDLKSYLSKLGVGMRNNSFPVQASILRYMINRITTVYDKPPTRYLLRDDRTRIPESDPQHILMLDVVRRAQLDLAWREVDKIRALVRQSVIRFFPSDFERAVTPRIFTPNLVHRIPDPAAPDRIEQDQVVVLKLARDVVELWWRQSVDGESRWFMMWVNDAGKILAIENQPFGETGFMSPYGDGTIIPVSLVYDTFSGGHAYLEPRMSRAAWPLNLNLLNNELIELIVQEAHTETVWRTNAKDDPPPRQSGPGQTVKIAAEDQFEKLQSDPKIAESQVSAEFMHRQMLMSEDLNPNELSSSFQPATGAALRVQERGLIARREAQIPLAERDERIAWQKLRAVHNLHARLWGLDQLDEDTNMIVEIGDLDFPVSPLEELNVLSRELSLGLASPIDAIMKTQNLTREAAIVRYEQVRQDLENFPPLMRPEVQGDSGEPGFSDAVNQLRQANGAGTADSTTDAILDISAAERREGRRN